jgi:hypothetical protein
MGIHYRGQPGDIIFGCVLSQHGMNRNSLNSKCLSARCQNLAIAFDIDAAKRFGLAKLSSLVTLLPINKICHIPRIMNILTGR